jgi:xanthine/uracil permease
MLSKAMLTGEKSNRIMLAGAALFLLFIALFSFTGNFILLAVPFVLTGLLLEVFLLVLFVQHSFICRDQAWIAGHDRSG